VLDELAHEVKEGRAIEDRGEPEMPGGVLQGDRAEDMGGLALPERIHPRLNAHLGPGLVQRAIQPEAGLVFPEDYPAAGRGFFLIAGSRSLIQTSCCS
jgi:hypothetical protein